MRTISILVAILAILSFSTAVLATTQNCNQNQCRCPNGKVIDQINISNGVLRSVDCVDKN